MPRRTIPWLIASAVLPALVVLAVGRTMLMLPAALHFTVGSIAALVTFAGSVALTRAGVRDDDGRTVLLATGFSTMSALLLVHAFATPGVLVGPNNVIAIAGGIGMPFGTAVLGLTALPGMRRPHGVRGFLRLQAALGLGILALGALAVLEPTLLPRVPTPRSPAALALLVCGLGLGAALVVRAVRTYLLTRRLPDALVAVGLAWLATAQYGWLVQGPMTVGYYVGHVLELAALVLVALPAVLDVRRTQSSRPLIGDLHARELVVAEEAFLGPRVRGLLRRLGERDVSTEEHTRRVALLAIQVGVALKLPAATLRHLAVGGLLHDMGKLAVPLEVLNKPGRLDDHEFALIQRHPMDGRNLLEELGGFHREARALVSDHHERLDGSGYPRGLRGDQLSPGTRILAACDVYDALVSDRVYRAAWSPERAIGLLRDEAAEGKFDPAVVEALARVADAPVHPAVTPAAPAAAAFQATLGTPEQPDAQAPAAPAPTVAPRGRV